jgi:hypothetical protein
MLTLTAIAALALSAPDSSLPFGGKLPFPAPRVTQVTEKTKCDFGKVLSIEVKSSILRATTPAGIITYHAGPEVQVFGKDGKPLGSISKLAVGQSVRVYYVVGDGARVSEVDIE